jgi:hypothetical protein
MNYQLTEDRQKKPDTFPGPSASIWVKEHEPVTQKQLSNTKAAPSTAAKVYCPMCTHTVDAIVENLPKHARVKRGQKCPRCSGSLDAGYIMYLERAA